MKWNNINSRKALTIIILIIIIFFGVYFLKINSEKSFPKNTFISGVEVSGKTFEKAKTILNNAISEYKNKKISFSFQGQTIEKNINQMQIDFLINKTLQFYLQKSNEEKIKNIFKKDKKTIKYPLLIKINNENLFYEIEKEFNLKDKAPINAKIYFDEKGNFKIDEEKNGLILNKKELIENITNNASKLKNEKIKITVLNIKPEFNKEFLNSKINEIKEKLSAKITLQDPIYSEGWTIKAINYKDWISFEEQQEILIAGQKIKGNYAIDYEACQIPHENFIEIKINKEKLNKYIDENLSKWLDRPAENVNIYKNNEGKIIIEGQGANGLKIQRTILKSSIENAINYKISKLKIPVLTINPTVTISQELQDLGIKENISIGHTSYYGSPANRIHNIKTASNVFNGTIIATDETFSFNKTLGRVDETTGYKKELVIKPEGTIPDFGGGVCQVSTTMYRTALFAGLPITERWPHTYAVSYYSQILGHGLDATIFLGGPDLKFKNDTGNDVLIQSYVKNDYELYIIFYGTSDGRKVEMKGPTISNHRNPPEPITEYSTAIKQGSSKVAEKAHPGFDALWYRYVTTKTGKIIEEKIETKYKAMPTKTVVGTGT
ncbi:MAG: VanW family protein [Candidatus Gracilibacteria bacterium]|jgi:vancomycin resistance protein YoaR